MTRAGPDELNKDITQGNNLSEQNRHSYDHGVDGVRSFQATPHGNAPYKEEGVQLRSNNSLGNSFTNMSQQQYYMPKQSRQQQMYNSIISNAIRKSGLDRLGSQNISVQSAGVGRRSGTTGSTAAYDGKVNVGLSTSSSMRSHEPMPHLVPQRTNVLTGATTKYYANQTKLWRQDYTDLVNFQKLKVKRESEVVTNASLKNNQFFQSRFDKTGQKTNKSSVPSGRVRSSITGKFADDGGSQRIQMPLKGRGVQISDKLNEINERRERMEMMTY